MVRDIITIVFLLLGVFLCFTTAFGVLRVNDFFMRCHIAGVADTLGVLSVCVAFAVQSGFSIMSVKLLILFIIMCICNPIGTHTLTRSAYKTGFPMEVTGKGDGRIAESDN